MKVSQLAKAAGTTPDTVRFYTREGLLQPTRNPDNNYHAYQADDLRRLRFVRKARQLGFSLPEIRSILDEAVHHPSPCPMVREVFEQRLRIVEEQIDDLVNLRDRMRSALRTWQGMPDGLPDGRTICQLIERWDEPSSRARPGPEAR